MARGFVYSPPPGRGRGLRAGEEKAPEPADGYKEKLIKYVPAEVIAFFAPIAALIGAGEDTWLIVAFVAGAIGTVALLYQANQEVPESQRPPAWNYVLALLAFAAWALATSPALAGVVDLNEKSVAIILALAAFLIPALDFYKAKADAGNGGGD